MKCHLIAIGQRMPPWVDQAVAEYKKRLAGLVTIQIIDIPAIRRGKNSDLKRIQQQEGQMLLEAVPRHTLPIALDAAGRQYDTLEFSNLVQGWIDASQDVAFLVGGPEGLAPSVLAGCRMKLSLSRLTFAHPLVRIVFAEQLYRAWSITQGLPYHR